MPVVVKCPNCNGPLDKAPSGPDQKCPYCGATLMATTYMPSPGAAPGPILGGTPGGAPPFTPPSAGGGWGTPAVGSPGGYQPPAPAPLPPMPVFTSRRRSPAGAIVSIVISLLMFGGIGVAVFMIQREVRDKAEQATQQAQQAVAERTKEVKLTPRALVPGTELEIPLPSSMGGPGGRVVATFTVDLGEEEAHEISMRSSAPYVGCRIKALDPDEKVLAKTVSDEDTAQIYAPFPKGKSTVVVDCDSHPTARSAFLLARPLPILLPGEQTMFVIEPGMESSGVAIVPTEPGRYAVAILCDDSSTSLQILDEKNALVGKQGIDSSSGRAVLEVDLQVASYLVQATRSSAASEKIQVTVALTPVTMEPIAMDTDVPGILSRWVESLTYKFSLGAESKIAVTLTSASFDHSVEIRRADGVSVATSGEITAGRKAKAAPNLPLAAGDYLIVVRGERYEISEGEFSLRVEAVKDDPPTKRRGGR